MTQKYGAFIENMQWYGEPEISWTEWLQKACVSDGALTELGEFLRSKLLGGTLIDVPCGLAKPETADLSVVDIATLLGVCTYVEADNDADVLGTRLHNPVRTTDGGMTIHTHLTDILAFMAQLEEHSGQYVRGIYISGLQPLKEFCEDPSNVSDVVIPYLEALYNELDRCSKNGDLVILNDANTLVLSVDEAVFPTAHPSVALMMRGFTCKRTCPHGKVQIYEKTDAC
ncbi:hypothetical protein COU78_01175 [Candidatus Peregrinibacteria bacterium CG10_big_fil_rev_8_21_14_0_10_49_24]|nr:MAG: hypothetical protein COV83_04140 [Candidatus Peregrinibacteria bacterium CG11_big_fil_rev_8_21_14_0_20_49_14]PIR51338.1 MAG: hypothetical protein COU78_01175 [Candidatus Peregrinibacteria bacterium CG10_big_fil_rev_8_21_14_0_10_49_24]PJA68102.1 MAG: hypothetical protein CO157_00990 [Candidatus Peregrinibacteria bacterium CG_4_9_14_3_um_filter_49_12]